MANTLITHFLFIKIQLNVRHATAKAMPAVARMEKMIVRGRSTDTSTSKGTPSYGTRPSAWEAEVVEELENVKKWRNGCI